MFCDDDLDWADDLDHSHLYGIAAEMGTFDFEKFSQLRFSYIRINTSELTNFDLKYPEYVKMLDLQGYGNDFLECPNIKQFINAEHVVLSCIKNVDVTSFQNMTKIQQF